MGECCKDPSSKKENSELLSKTILDYYTKYGQNRDLEKYLRFRKCRGNSSGSGCSDVQVCGTDRLCRSMETLGELRKKLSGSDTDENKSEKEGLKATLNITTPNESKTPPLSDNNRSPTTKPEAVKVKLKSERKSKKKSFNFNMESNIVINVSPKKDGETAASGIPEHPSLVKRDFESQTEDMLPKKLNYPETPAKPMAESQAKLEITIDEPQSISPASSLASVSNKHRLEWDSMADVGYEKSAITAAGNLRSQETRLSSLEKSGLKKFFAERGLSVQDDFVVIATTSKSAEKSIEKGKNIVEPLPVAAAESKNQKEAKKKWKIALEKYRLKYLNETLASNFNINESAVHSTPEPQSNPKQSKSTQEKPHAEVITEKIKNEIEKSCQTSIIGMVSKEIQCNPIIDKGKLLVT